MKLLRLSSPMLQSKLSRSPSFLSRNRYTGRNSIRSFLSSDSTIATTGTNDAENPTPTFTIGILRETYDNWERRAPLTPDQCRDFLSRQGVSNGNGQPMMKILVQPSTRRVFSDQQYVDAGASITESLQDADLLLGVKRPHPSVDVHELFDEQQTTMFFSHVIKGQPENMQLLEDLLDHHVQLIDYEKIALPDPTQGNKDKRLVAFGKYAGLAGMIDTLSVVGQRLLRSHSLSTPFLNCPPSIYHSTLEDAKSAVQRLGERIALEGLTIPSSLVNNSGMNEPLVLCLTGGPRGNVYGGVREIFDLLPNEVVAVDDLPALFEEIGNDPSSACQRKVYGVVPEMNDIYRLISGSNEAFDRSHFVEHPEMYRSMFAENIAPYIHVLVNGIYWEHRFPKLLTKNDMYHLYHDFGNERLMVVSDISCDISGSIEFLERSTSIDKPCYQYDPIAGHESCDSMGDFGITVCGVDILPSELPIESSSHFGTALENVLPDLMNAKSTADGSDDCERSTIDAAKLSRSLSRALITTKEGDLAQDFKYLAPIMEHTAKQTPEEDGQSLYVYLEGHLFDSNLINHVLDLLEVNGLDCVFKECNVQYRPVGEAPIKSNVLLKITGDKQVDLASIQEKMKALVDVVPTAEANIRWIDSRESGIGVKRPNRTAYVESNSVGKNVLLLGSGRVSASVLDWMGRNTGHHILVASNDEKEAKAVASLSKSGNSNHRSLDILNDDDGLSSLIEKSDLVISLLPAMMHPKVAHMCISAKKDLVTASYESKEMLQLRHRAEANGVRILNEIGLDPGLDHCSAMKIIDDISDRGGVVVSFESVCGGLPAPEAADNPLRYKFSWSPRGVISASQNDAKYLQDSRLVEVRGNELLASATPFTDSFKELHLECLPNRDSLNYQNTYGLDQARTIFRGTLRYLGFSSLMHVFQTMGLFDTFTPIDNLETWEDVLTTLRRNRGGFTSVDDFFLACSGEDTELAHRAKEAMAWLGIYGEYANQPIGRTLSDRTIVDLFCRKLEQKLKFGTSERDMVVMHHKIGAEFEDGSTEEHHSSLQVFGTESTMTAMCRTVGYPAAAAADLILRDDLGGIKPGLLLPTSKSIYIPILDAVEKEGIRFEERCSYYGSGAKELA